MGGRWRSLTQYGRITKKRYRVDEGTIDYFTATEYDATVELIEQTLSDAGVSNKINSIQYDKNTRTMHYEWVWQI